MACCTLHNITEVHGDHFNDNWLDDINTLEQPGTSAVSSDSAQAIRSALVEYYS